MTALGVLSGSGELLEPPPKPGASSARPVVPRRAITAHQVLNEAYAYPRPSSFARGIRFDPGETSLLLISGTASVDEAGLTAHVGDFRAQLWRTYRNITALLAAEGATWHDIIRTTCYLRDIERDYRDFNEIRTAFFGWLGLDPLPASTGIQARLCREDLLVEIEAIAVVGAGKPPARA
jgi:enamine deaminase RidA (YjgF/YER057c/UK114 family)